MTSPVPIYRGRFAPTPSGPLHFGSVVAALGSYLQARRHRGQWLVRIEDVDEPRNAIGASDSILRELERLGLQWDGEVTYQTARIERYAAALSRLEQTGRLFACACTRRELDGGPYPGTCRAGIAQGRSPRARRVRVDSEIVEFEDALQGRQRQDLASEVGDFVVHRADGIYAYHLAVVVDDAEQGITEIVRGADLLDSTPRQIYLQRALGLPTPGYLHLPVATNARGEKLSKQTGARAVSARDARDVLCDALGFLGQAPPAELRAWRVEEALAWAAEHWTLPHVPRSATIAACG